MTSPIVTSFFDGPTNTVSYVVADPATGKAAIIEVAGLRRLRMDENFQPASDAPVSEDLGLIGWYLDLAIWWTDKAEDEALVNFLTSRYSSVIVVPEKGDPA